MMTIATIVHSVPSRSKTSSKTSSNFHKCRPRKVQSVDTNPSSYDRTDPFLAFNVLLSLIGSLPSRVGGCQYKFSPEEHKLSLHLLNIVEPFVGLTRSRRTIVQQPTEILDSIIFHLDSKHDLLSLGLSCRRIHSIIFPRHFDYRTIRCKVSAISVWNHLNVHRSLARNVRRLEILDERSTEANIIPPGLLASDTDLESSDDELELHAKQERYLTSALMKMSSLQSFSWSCNHSPISIDHVWPTLLRCHSLKRVEINDNLIFSPQPTGMEGIDGSTPALHPQNLPGLKTVDLRSTRHTYGSAKYPSLARISGMLDQCPNLESLNIDYSHPRFTPGCTYPPVDDIFVDGSWPRLTALTLTNLRCSRTTGFNATAAFLYAHVNLEVLHLDIGGGMGGGGQLILPYNSLPRLRELRSHQEIIKAILECECDSPRPLETLKGVQLPGSSSSDPSRDQDQSFFVILKQYGKALKRIELTGWSEIEDIRRLVDCAPGLTWLDIGKKISGPNPSLARDKSIPMFNTMEWAILLSALPELSTFHGIHFFYSLSDTSFARKTDELSASDRSRIRKNDEIAYLLAWKCPKLRRVDHWEDGIGRVIVLVRDRGANASGNGNGAVDREKIKWEVRRVKL